MCVGIFSIFLTFASIYWVLPLSSRVAFFIWPHLAARHIVLSSAAQIVYFVCAQSWRSLSSTVFFLTLFHDIPRLYLWCGIELNKQQQQWKSTLKKYPTEENYDLLLRNREIERDRETEQRLCRRSQLVYVIYMNFIYDLLLFIMRSFERQRLLTFVEITDIYYTYLPWPLAHSLIVDGFDPSSRHRSHYTIWFPEAESFSNT